MTDFEWLTERRCTRQLRSTVAAINRLEPDTARLSDVELKKRTAAFRKRFRAGETLDLLLPEVFATVREAAQRTLGQRHDDVQLMGGIVLQQGKITEMATGEGKTLTAVLAAYLNSLTGSKVHVVTVNDYLAKRDHAWMGPIYEFLGIRVGVIQASFGFAERAAAYQADITYGTAMEFINDYLRDHMRHSAEKSDMMNYMLYGDVTGNAASLCQRGLHYAIVDEIDSILIDSGIQPISLAAATGTPPVVHVQAFEVAGMVKRDVHFKIDDKRRKVEFFADKTAQEIPLPVELKTRGKEGWEKYVEQSLMAIYVLQKDRDYLVKEGMIVVVDPFTGRAAPQRSFGGGLQQALEVKESLPMTSESKPVLSITYPIYFRRYKKIAGMTGTAKTEAREFRRVYALKVVTIPPYLPLARVDLPDVYCADEQDKLRTITEEIQRRHERGQPVLAGTNSVAKSERLSEFLSTHNIEHVILNARQHEREAEIIAQAGQEGKVTIVTSMAGRGVDIVLGEDMSKRGGLHVIAVEHHDAVRIDNQLRGRAGRRGDPGSSQIYVSIEDDLLRIYRNNKGVQRKLQKIVKVSRDKEIPIQGEEVARLISRAQKTIQNYHYQLRKKLMKRADEIRKWRDSDKYDRVLDKWPDLIF
jgi:preprotein translocase subunit SecA